MNSGSTLRAMRPTFVFAAIGIVFMLFAPQVLALFTIINLTTAIALAILALSLALVWGYGGILCFGQVAFFGLGAYAYTIGAINFGGSTWAILLAVAVAAAFAAVVGYFMFYGRVSDVYLGVITLTVTLILYSLIRRTSGPEYKIGNALLGGFNGVGSPPLNLPWNARAFLFPEQVFYVAMAALIIAYVFAGWLVTTHFGRVCVAIRENETRAELLGYDARAYKLGIFTISAGIAGLAGVFFCNGVGRVTPDVFGLYNAALTIIWVIVGGRGTLIGPIIATFGLFYLTASLGGQQTLNNNLVLGIILIVFVLLVPRGLCMHFGGVRAVDQVDFALEDRELRCLIGPNGAGKSTFFKCLTGQLTPTAGEITIRGTPVAGAQSHEIASLGVGIKTQVPNVFDGLTAEENIWLSARRWHGGARARTLTAETIERLRLGEIRRSLVGRLAHGQRQWVELGMVVAAEPWLVLLDEPAAGMTHEETARTAELILEINRTAALIVVEHDMQFIRMISRRVTLFHEGRILMEDTMDAISSDRRAREVYLGHRA
ncbi:MAG: ABC transporter permease subunit [Gemmobacter sp.]